MTLPDERGKAIAGIVSLIIISLFMFIGTGIAVYYGLFFDEINWSGVIAGMIIAFVGVFLIEVVIHKTKNIGKF